MAPDEPIVFKLETWGLPFDVLEIERPSDSVSLAVVEGTPARLLKFYPGDDLSVPYQHYVCLANDIAFRLSIELGRHISAAQPSRWPDWVDAEFHMYDLVVRGMPNATLEDETLRGIAAAVVASLGVRPPAAELYVQALKETSGLSRFVLLWAASDTLCGNVQGFTRVSVTQTDAYLHSLGASAPSAPPERGELTTAAVLRNALAHAFDRGTVKPHRFGDPHSLSQELVRILKKPILELRQADGAVQQSHRADGAL